MIIKRILLLFCIIPLLPVILVAQDINLVSRYSYYTHEEEATLIIYGNEFRKVKSIVAGKDKLQAPVYKVNTDNLLAKLSIGKLEFGKNELTCRVQMEDGSDVTRNIEILKLRPKPNEVKVDRLTGGLIVDDLPFYPFGFYTGFPVGDIPIQEVYNGMNLIGVYQNNEDSTLAQRKAYMDLCASLGIKVNYHLNGLVGTPHNRAQFTIGKEEEMRRDELLKKEVKMFRDHPALLSWYMNDEPIGQGRPPELLEKAYNMIREIDPYHPVSVVFVIPDRAKPFENALDIAMTDPYPIPGDVRNVQDAMIHLKRHFRYRKAFWMVPQAFGGGEFWSREPTAAEIRVMTYLGIYEGAMGIKYFIRRLPNNNPKSRIAWHECSRIAHEVSLIIPWLFNENGKKNLTTTNDHILAASWQKNQSALVMVINSKNKPESFTINLENIEHSGKARLLFENRSLEINKNNFTDIIDAFGVRIYLLEAQADNAVQEKQKHNLFINKGFEYCYSPGVPFGCYAGSNRRGNYDGAVYFVDSRKAYEGNYSLRFNYPSDSSNISLGFFKMLVNKGSLYKCSLWASTPKHQDSVSFEVRLNELELVKKFSAGEDWSNYSFYFKVDRDVKSVGLTLSPRSKGTIWIDQVEVYPDPLIDVKVTEGPKAMVKIQSLSPRVDIYYSTEKIDSPKDLMLYKRPFEVKGYTELRINLQKERKPFQKMSHIIPLSKATFKNCTFQTPYSSKYQAQGNQSLLDGVYGTLAFRDKKWLGWNGTDVEFVVDLGKEMKIHQATVHFLVSINDGIHPPLSMEVNVSRDGKQFTRLEKVENPKKPTHQNPNYFLNLTAKGEVHPVRFVKFKIKSPVTIPEGYLFSGTDAWIFIDEVLIE